MAEYDDEGAPSNGKRELLLYDVPVTLPLIAGAAAVVGGLALSIGGSHRVVGLDVAYFLAIALVLGGVVAYLVVGMWLLPASMVVAGLVLFSANQALLYLRGWAPLLAGPYLILGTLGIIEGVAHAYRRPSSEPE